MRCNRVPYGNVLMESTKTGMRNILTIVAMIPLAFAYAQTPDDDVVYTAIMDTLTERRAFEFYYSRLQQTDITDYTDNPLDSIVVFDPETYEEVVKSAADVAIELDSTNRKEARLFKQRSHFPNGLYLISKIDEDNLHKRVKLQDYIYLESYPKAQDLTEMSDLILYKGAIGPYSTMPSTQENTETYKYAIKAYLAFSGVVWNKTKTYCLVECGYHYSISDEHPDAGSSGEGFQVIMKNENGNLRCMKFISLWEE